MLAGNRRDPKVLTTRNFHKALTSQRTHRRVVLRVGKKGEGEERRKEKKMPSRSKSILISSSKTDSLCAGLVSVDRKGNI